VKFVPKFFLGLRNDPDKEVLHFLHIGKTGGSALKWVFNKHQIPDRFTLNLHPHDVTLRDIPRGEGVIFFLRDPISRFVSGFYSRQRQGQPRYWSPWSDSEKIGFEAFNTPNALATALNSDIPKEKNMAHEAMMSIEHLRDRYSKWFEDKDYFLSRSTDVFFVGFQEQLEKDFETLKAKLGLPETANLPSDSILSHENPKHLDYTLSQSAIKNLEAWFKSDFELVELCRDMFHN